MSCVKENQYWKNGNCCDRCPAGKYVRTDCSGQTSTDCDECKEGHYTATANNLYSCQVCKDCGSDNNLIKVKNCTAKENTVCGCKPGLFCHNDSCDHCLAVTDCAVGNGVLAKANRTHDTVCGKCENGTFSDVTDPISPCKPHTRCEDIGRKLKTPGTSEIDAVCGDFLHHNCQWMLPAGLWAGLVLTALILFAVVICRKARRRSYRAGSARGAVTLVERSPAASGKPPGPVLDLDLPVPATSLDLDLALVKANGNGHCQESCALDDVKLPLFTSDENAASCSLDSSFPITPLKASVSFAETSYVTKGAGHNFLRTYSEPQEDEWCGI